VFVYIQVFLFEMLFLFKMSFFGNDDPYSHKNQQKSCKWSSLITRLRAKFRVETEKLNKATG